MFFLFFPSLNSLSVFQFAFHATCTRNMRCTDLGVDPRACTSISAPIRAAPARKQKPGGFLTVELLRAPKCTYDWVIKGWQSGAVTAHFKRASPTHPTPLNLAPFPPPQRGETLSSSSPHSLRSTPFSLCYNHRESAALIGPDACQSKKGPAPEVALSFVINQLFAAFNVAAYLRHKVHKPQFSVKKKSV